MRAVEDVTHPLRMRDLPTTEVDGRIVLTDTAAATLVDRLIARESDLLERLADE